MPVSDEYLRYVLDQLSSLGRVSSKRMFGGAGLFHEDRFFGFISTDTLYFKVGDSNRADYEQRGMGRLRPFASRPELSLTYFEVPADVLEDPEECALWARKAAATARVSVRRKR